MRNRPPRAQSSPALPAPWSSQVSINRDDVGGVIAHSRVHRASPDPLEVPRRATGLVHPHGRSPHRPPELLHDDDPHASPSITRHTRPGVIQRRSRLRIQPTRRARARVDRRLVRGGRARRVRADQSRGIRPSRDPTPRPGISRRGDDAASAGRVRPTRRDVTRPILRRGRVQRGRRHRRGGGGSPERRVSRRRGDGREVHVRHPLQLLGKVLHRAHCERPSQRGRRDQAARGASGRIGRHPRARSREPVRNQLDKHRGAGYGICD